MRDVSVACGLVAHVMHRDVAAAANNGGGDSDDGDDYHDGGGENGGGAKGKNKKKRRASRFHTEEGERDGNDSDDSDSEGEDGERRYLTAAKQRRRRGVQSVSGSSTLTAAAEEGEEEGEEEMEEDRDETREEEATQEEVGGEGGKRGSSWRKAAAPKSPAKKAAKRGQVGLRGGPQTQDRGEVAAALREHGILDLVSAAAAAAAAEGEDEDDATSPSLEMILKDENIQRQLLAQLAAYRDMYTAACESIQVSMFRDDMQGRGVSLSTAATTAWLKWLSETADTPTGLRMGLPNILYDAGADDFYINVA
eukprot:CAMPEP_0175059498 /NCGR_PEP_ID=MMETSP0052_2-20121109/12465_1 /TAXON_ID=51329 ORGANISM="Polytomella parva, Strain SAG 63-3" /NCGR_SAMPLE_ID=MMETSP0052_2 /ASSEMBLY_ACC=CAM_ASM_000194 /LENGTH=308 /DNA_ID=CAMNT_0016325053 /DNA_START=189 /DNA_END=1115 /DNA_ORIENTATION=-